MVMRSLRRSLPPIASLLAFEAASRLLSFTSAADELGVTQAAVSRQIRELEEFLQVRLFLRNYRSIELTPAGVLLQGGVSTNLAGLAAVCERVRETRDPTAVVVGMTSAFGAYWLATRLQEFRQIHPDIELRLAVNDEIVDLAKQRIDVSIRYGAGDWPHLRSEYLIGAEDMPVCSPTYWASRSRPTEPAQLKGEKLICLEGTPVFLGSQWRDWFALHGVAGPEAKHQFTVNNFNMLMQATLSGQGIALAGYPLINDLLANGLLVPAIELTPMRVQGGYYVVEPEGEIRKKSCLLFRQWLFDRARRDAVDSGTERLLVKEATHSSHAKR